MNSTVIVGIVLALVGIIVYITRSWTRAEVEKAKEKATQDGESQMALDKISALEKEKLRIEYEERSKEKREEEDFESYGSNPPLIFYPRVRGDEDPDDLN